MLSAVITSNKAIHRRVLGITSGTITHNQPKDKIDQSAFCIQGNKQTLQSWKQSKHTNLFSRRASSFVAHMGIMWGKRNEFLVRNAVNILIWRDSLCNISIYDWMEGRLDRFRIFSPKWNGAYLKKTIATNFFQGMNHDLLNWSLILH